VVKVPDGDTFYVSPPINGEDRIRIDDIKAPERKRGRYQRGEPGSLITTKILRKLIFGKMVDIDIVCKDIYGRWVAHVFLNGKNIATILKRRSPYFR